MMAADYSQIELRIMAHSSATRACSRAFADDRDIHLATAPEVFGADPAQVASDQRRAAKAINFGLIYGMSSFGSRAPARHRARRCAEVHRPLFPALSGRQALHGQHARRGRERGYVETVFGRRLYLPDIRRATRSCASTPNAARSMRRCRARPADIIKRAMLAVHEWLLASRTARASSCRSTTSWCSRCRPSRRGRGRVGLRSRMARAADLQVPLKVDVGRACQLGRGALIAPEPGG
jgi:DNA polymerase-1